jgi:hypothetical protein
LYSSPNVVRVIKSRRKWAGDVACMGRGEVHAGFCWRSLRERDRLEDLGEDGRITLRRIGTDVGH